ncbi:NifU N-terminal domain-containing protein [Acidimicrobiaceae bacterium]|nr:NifU N-terminal domain-containing protein [Acidimicrobiaceae bacterium]
MIFILKLTNNMELIDTPNPNAKKIESDIQEDELVKNLNSIEGVSSVFLGPGFVTITKYEDVDWELITQDIINIFDKL